MRLAFLRSSAVRQVIPAASARLLYAMPLRDLLHKKDKIDNHQTAPLPDPSPSQEFRFVRTDTHTEEDINPPAYEGDYDSQHGDSLQSPKRRSFFRRSHSPSSSDVSPHREKGERRISNLLHLDRSISRSSSTTSVNVPADLPQIENDPGNEQEREAQWEKRATTLIQGNLRLASSPGQPSSSPGGYGSEQPQQQRSRSRSNSRINDPKGDVGSRAVCVI